MSPELVEISSRAGELVERLSNAARTEWFGFKDSRASLLLPFWHGIAPIERKVMALRDPRHVAGSLAGRDRIDEEWASFLWLRYTLSVLAEVQVPTLAVAYEDFFLDPQSVIVQLADFLDFDAAEAPHADVIKNIRPELRHHELALQPRGPVTELAVKVFEKLRAGGSVDERLLQQYSTGLFVSHEDPDIGPAAHVDRQLDRVRTAVAESRGARERWQKKAGRLERERSDLRAESHEKQKTIDELSETLQAKELDIGKAHQEAEKAPREAGKLVGWMEELDVATPALLGSRRWQVGNALGELHQRLTSRPRVPMASEQLSHVLEEFRSWRNNSGGTPYTPSRTPEPLQAQKADRATPGDTKKAVDLGRENWHSRPVQVRSQEKSVVVYTAIAGNYDTFKIPKVFPEGWRLVCFQDDWNKPSLCESRPFDFHHNDPARRSRYVKLHPHVYFPDHEWSIWVDANLLIEGDLSPLVKHVREAQGIIGAYLHPHRSNVFEEADEVIKRGGLDDEDIVRQQVLRYREAGMFLQGLYETGVFVRLHNDKKVIALMDAWWREINNGSRRDQLSFPVVSYKLGIEPVALGPLGDSVHNSPLFTRFAHGHEKHVV